ncbi:MAG: flavodoxin family protein [bacterium]
MKIVAINGSHRGEQGYTQFLLNLIKEGVEETGSEFETIVLAKQKINICKGCRVCQTTKHYLECVYDQNDDVAQLFNIIRDADFLIFATPIYIFNMTGLMKIFLERITSTADSAIHTISENGLFFHHIDKTLFSKPFMLLTCQDNIEDETNKNVVSYFKTFSKFLDASLIGVINRKLGGLIKHGKDKTAESKYPEIINIYKAIKNCGKEISKTGVIAKKTLTEANKNIIKMPVIVEILLKFNFIRNNKMIMNKIFEKAKQNMV